MELPSHHAIMVAEGAHSYIWAFFFIDSDSKIDILEHGSYNSSTNYSNHHFDSGLSTPPAYQSSFIH